MFNSKLQKLALSLAFIVLSAACTTPLILAPSSRPFHNRAYKILGDTTAQSCQTSILGIPISTDASLHTTLTKAKNAIGADALVEITIDEKNLLTGFYNQTCTLLHAKGVKFTDEQAPFVTAGPAVAALPKTITDPASQAPPAASEKPKPANEPQKTATTKPEPEPKKLTRAEKRRLAKLEEKNKRREARRKRRQQLLEKKQEAKKKAEEKKKKAQEAKKKAEEEKRKAEEARKKAEEERPKAQEAKKKAEQAKPVPQEYGIFCKYKPGQPILVETKSEKIEAEFIKCVHFGVRVKKTGGPEGVIPFEKIWSVRMRAPEASPATPAKPRN